MLFRGLVIAVWGLVSMLLFFVLADLGPGRTVRSVRFYEFSLDAWPLIAAWLVFTGYCVYLFKRSHQHLD